MMQLVKCIIFDLKYVTKAKLAGQMSQKPIKKKFFVHTTHIYQTIFT